MTKRKCIRISPEEKIEILRYLETNKELSDNRIAEIFSTKFKKEISRRAINDLKRNSQKTLNMVESGAQKAYRNYKLKYAQIDDELYQWIEKMEVIGAILNDHLIILKALEIAKKNGMNDFKASSGWLTKFKKRHQLKLRKLHGESFSVKEINYDEFLIELKEKINEYGEENVYNADETGLFYKLIPSKTICKNIRKGYKLLKDRISILLCANMKGSVKRKPLVIGKFGNPRCLKNFPTNKYVEYAYSKKSWMNYTLFNKWLLEWDFELEKLSKKILLVIDNCPAHKISIELKNIEIKFIPPNLTSVIQPMDQGVISTFKSYFNSKKLSDIIEKVEAGQELFSCYKNLTIKDAIIFLYLAWNDVSQLTIENCFIKAKWFSKETSLIDAEDVDMGYIYDEFIRVTDIKDPVDQKLFNDLCFTENDAILEDIEKDEIITTVDEKEHETELEMENVGEINEEIITKKEVYNALQTLKNYFNQQEGYNDDAIRGLDYLSKSLRAKRLGGTLEHWFTKKTE